MSRTKQADASPHIVVVECSQVVDTELNPAAGLLLNCVGGEHDTLIRFREATLTPDTAECLNELIGGEVGADDTGTGEVAVQVVE